MNIDEMPAGREMDILIAERVMGLELNKSNSNVPTFLTPKLSWSPPVPHYSTDMVVAWAVAETISQRKCPKRDSWFWVTLGLFGDFYRCTIGADIIDALPQEKPIIEEADTMPLAICRAALKVIKGSCEHNTKLGPSLTTAILSSLPGALQGKLGGGPR